MRLAGAASARRTTAWSSWLNTDNRTNGSIGNGHDAGNLELSLG